MSEDQDSASENSSLFDRIARRRVIQAAARYIAVAGAVATGLTAFWLVNTSMRHPWHFARTAAFERLHGNAGFEAVVAAIRIEIAAGQRALEALGDESPPCISNMRVTTN